MDSIEKEPTTQKGAARTIRCGRPPAERAGEVEERILDAAHKVFLERGFDGASIDLIAETARSGKPTIYSRFPNKEALLEATVVRTIARRNARLQSHKPDGVTIEERLASVAFALLGETLSDDYIGMLRVALGEARRAPDLVRGLIRMARERGSEIATRMLAEVVKCETFPAMLRDSGDPHALAARYFLDLVLLPPLMRALAGENVQDLRAEADLGVPRRVAFFLAAFRDSAPRPTFEPQSPVG